MYEIPFASQSSLSFASIELWNVLLSVFVQNANDRSDDFVLSFFVPESDEPLPEPFPDPDPQPANKLSDMHRHAPTANNFLNFLIIFTSNNIMYFANSLSKNCS